MAAGESSAEVGGLVAGTRYAVRAFEGMSCPKLGDPPRGPGGGAWDAVAAAEATTAAEP